MDEIILSEKIPTPEIPKKWNFNEADKHFDSHIFNWRRLTSKVLSELWVFYNKLARPGKRTDLVANATRLPTWDDWIKSKGIDRTTAYRHFKALGWLPGDSLVSKMTGNAENYTRQETVDRIRAVLGEIDLDPASCKMAQKIVKAKKYYTMDTNGLDKKWEGRVFLNPPYGMPLIREFTDKLIQSLPDIDAAILLTNDQTDTDWWQSCAVNAQVICMPDGRERFYTPTVEKTCPTNGQTFFYFGNNKKRFIEIFKDKGILVKVI